MNKRIKLKKHKQMLSKYGLKYKKSEKSNIQWFNKPNGLNIFDKKELRRVLETLINSADFYELHFTGGTHIIFEDGNYRKSDIKFCKEESIKEKNLMCYLICELLENFTEEEIKDIVERID